MLTTSWAVLCRVVLILACGVALGAAVVVFERNPQIGVAVLLAAAWFNGRRGALTGWIHGSAKLAEWQDLYSGGMLGDQGYILGATLGRPPKRLAFASLLTANLRNSALAVRLFLTSIGSGSEGASVIRVNDACHLASFSRTGGGKGTCVVIPTLLSYEGSMVVTDPKSENADKTQRHRQRVFKHRVVRLEPFAEHSDTYNPMDAIPHHESPFFIPQCLKLAEALVVRTGLERDDHWLDSAERVLTAIIAFVASGSTDPTLRNLQSVRSILASREKYTAAVKILQQSGDLAGGMLARLGDSLSWHQDREEASVLSTVQRMLNFLDNPLVAANMARTNFDPKELKRGRMTVYLCIKPEFLKILAPLQRLWLTCLLSEVVADGDEKSKVLFLLDEVANLGRLQVLEDAVCLYRGMGVRLWFIFQSYAQVKTCFGDGAATFLDNVGTQQYFGVQSLETAQMLSDRIGAATVTAVSEDRGSSRSRSDGPSPDGKQGGATGSSRNASRSEIARKLLLPEEILTMSPRTCIILHLHHAPILARLIPYHASPLFRSRLGRLRTGRPPRLGLKEGFASAVLLACTLSLAAWTLAPPPAPSSPPANPAMQAPGGGPWNRIGAPYRPVGAAPRGYQRRRSSSPNYGGANGQVGFLR
jgi:type IV secretion system protein VirD4